MAITINYDYTDGTEISYAEGLKLGDNFTTCCLDFFSFETSVEVKVQKENGEYIMKSELLDDNYYTPKEIRTSHNIHKMLKANFFKWKTPNPKI